MAEVLPPIFVFGAELAAFETTDAAEAYLDPWDVNERFVTAIYDSTGLRLEVRVERPVPEWITRVFGPVEYVALSPDPSGTRVPAHLDELLRSALGRLHTAAEASLAGASHAELIAIALRDRLFR